jgi:hypothetical protein
MVERLKIREPSGLRPLEWRLQADETTRTIKYFGVRQ